MYRRLVAQSVTGYQGVLFVQFHLVVIAQGYRDTALRVFGRGLAQTVLGDYQHLPRGCQFDGRPHASDAGADHQKVRSHLLLR